MSENPHRPLTRANWLVLLAAFLGWLFDGFEIGLFPLVAGPALRDLLGHPTEDVIAQWMGIITALFLLGAASGGIVFGWLGDRIGRVRAMSLSILTYSLCTGLGYFAGHPWQIGLFRFLAALGMGGEWSLGVALVMECWPDRWRPWLAGAIGAAANVGMVLVALIRMSLQVTEESWRIMFLVGAGPAVLVFLIRLFVPESERWKAAVEHGTTHPVREVFSPALRGQTLLGIAFAAVALVGTWGSIQWIPLWVGTLPGNAAGRAAESQLVSSLGAVVGSLLAPLVGGRIGRRATYFGLCIVSLVVCQVLFRAFAEYSSGLLWMITLTGATTASFYGWLPLYLPELFPTRMRATGQGVCFNFGRILAAIGAITQGRLVGYFDGSYAMAGATITFIYLAGAAMIWLGRETKGKPLPE